MLEKIVIFILFLGPLVFFHELGHFLFARLFGVRVEVFSIGFGPKIFKFKRGDTEYALSLIPLGGYVKMYGDDPFNKDSIPEEERRYSFTHKSKWARFWIVFGGPLANFIMAYWIFFGLLFVGEKVPEIKLGSVKTESVFYQKGFRTGDVIYKVNGKKILNPTDIAMDTNNKINTVSVKRSEDVKIVQVGLGIEDFFKSLGEHPPYLRRPFVVNKKGEVFALSRSQTSVTVRDSLESFLEISRPEMIYLYKVIDETKNLSKAEPEIEKSYSLSFQTSNNFLKALADQEFRILDLAILKFSDDSPALQAGLKEGDVITALNGQGVFTFQELRGNLQKSNIDVQTVKIWREGKEVDFTLKPKFVNKDGKIQKLLGVWSAGVMQAPGYIKTESKGLFGSFTTAFARTADGMVKVVDGFKKLITGQVSLENIGGPFTIGKVAADSYKSSLSFFFQLMALISINLGIINLFPIPVLDGGHILFIGLEIVNGGPLSRRKMEIAQQVGLSLLLMLMVGAIFNDFRRLF